MKRALLRLIAGFAPALFAGLFAVSAQAATVSIQAPAEVTKGQTFQVTYVVSGASAVDTVRFNGTYTSSLVELKSMSPSSALDSRSPSTAFNQANGTFSYGAFTIADPANGSVRAGTFTFTAKDLGTATVALNGSSLVLSAGLNQLSGSASAKIRIVEPKANEPVRVTPSSTNSNLVVASASHPDESLWYNDRNVQINWKAEGSGLASVFVAFDDQPEGPATEKVGSSGSKAFKAPGDGVWYAHIIVSYADGRSLRRDYRLQIDTVAPKPFALSVDYENVDINVQNYLRFAATDETSGIAEYRISEGLDLLATTTNPYYALIGMAGNHMLTVKAVDFAGNVSKASISVHLGAVFTEAEKNNLWWIILVAMALVALTGLMVGMLLMRRRKEEKPATKNVVHRTRRK